MRYWIVYLIVLVSTSINASVVSYGVEGAFDRSVDHLSDVSYGDLFQATFTYDDEAPP